MIGPRLSKYFHDTPNLTASYTPLFPPPRHRWISFPRRTPLFSKILTVLSLLNGSLLQFHQLFPRVSPNRFPPSCVDCLPPFFLTKGLSFPSVFSKMGPLMRWISVQSCYTITTPPCYGPSRGTPFICLPYLNIPSFSQWYTLTPPTIARVGGRVYKAMYVFPRKIAMHTRKGMLLY